LEIATKKIFSNLETAKLVVLFKPYKNVFFLPISLIDVGSQEAIKENHIPCVSNWIPSFDGK